MTQSMLSSFFSPKQEEQAAPRRASPLKATASDPILLDLSSDDDVSTTARKKRALSSTSKLSVQQPNTKRSKASTETSTAQAFAKWKFTPSQAAAEESQIPIAGPSKLPKDAVLFSDDYLPSLSPPKTQKEKRRHDLFVKKLLGPRNPLDRPHGYMDKDSAYAPVEDDATSKISKKSSAIDPKGKGKEKVKYTPLEQQWLDIKQQNPDVILLMEVGYKFRFFGDDAVIASKTLGIAHYQDKHFMSAMVPLPRLHIHIKRLLQDGHKVGVIRQIETAALKKVGDNKSGPFERKLTELYTLATWVDDLETEDFSGRSQSGTILCLVEKLLGGAGMDEKVHISLVAVQPSTGDLVYDDFDDGFMRNELETRLLHLHPTEVVLAKDVSKSTQAMIKHCITHTSVSPPRTDKLTKKLTYEKALSHLTDFYTEAARDEDRKDQTLSMVEKIAELPQGVVMAASALAKHLSQFSLIEIFRQGDLRHFHNTISMVLNGNTLTNLDIFVNDTDFTERGSLFWLLDNCKTAMGRRQLRRWVSRPLTDLKALQERLDCVTEIVEGTDYRFGKLRGMLNGLPDLERGLARIHYGRCTPQELLKVLLAFLRISANFKASESSGFASPLLKQAVDLFPAIKEKVDGFLEGLNQKACKEGNKEEVFKSEAFPDLDDAKDNVSFVDVELQEELKRIRTFLKKPAIQYASIAAEEYLIEVRISESSKVPTTWMRINSTKQIHRYRPPEVQKLVDERNQGLERLSQIAEASYQTFLKRVSAESDSLRSIIRKLSDVDCLFSLATIALRNGYCKPSFVENQCLTIKDGRHPMAEILSEDPYVPNDVFFDKGKLECMILSGSNAGGKSSLARMTALLVVMAQIGCYVPAESCTLGVFDAVFTRMGASDDISRGRSTFMVELSETSEILKLATSRSLVILDELGRGTSSFDGLAIALATLTHLCTVVRSHTIFITHYAQLVQERGLPETCQAFHMSFHEKGAAQAIPEILFLYKLVEGAALKSHGLNVARLAGLPTEVYAEAYEQARQLESSTLDRQIANSARRIITALDQPEGNADDELQMAEDLLHVLERL